MHDLIELGKTALTVAIFTGAMAFVSIFVDTYYTIKEHRNR